MLEKKICEGVYAVGANDFNRKLFDELIPLPYGTSYNSYVIKGQEKTAILDAVDPMKKDVLRENLRDLNINSIDFIISHHAEQDHSGAIVDLLDWFPNAKVLTNEKCKSFLMDLLCLPEEKFITISDREKISLGGKTLEFIFTPWVHWPETFVSYLHEDKTLFSCDLFGSHLASEKLFADESENLYSLAKRYYAEIMMPFRTAIKGHLEKLSTYKIEMICPSHGPIYKNPAFILDAYKEWISDDVKNLVVIPYVSMHGSVEKMVEILNTGLNSLKIETKIFKLSEADIGELAMALVDASTVVFGIPAVLAQIHPLASNALYLANLLRPKTKYFSYVSSYGWGAKLAETINSLIPNFKAKLLEPVICKGYPKTEDIKKLQQLAVLIKERNS